MSRFLLEIEPVPGNWSAPPVQRLKGVLKRLLRSYGFRCVAAREVTQGNADTRAPDVNDLETNEK